MVVFSIFFLFGWQQRVSYEIKADLDIEEHSLRAIEYFTYYNNSPYAFDTVYMHLYANAYKDGHTVYAQERRRLGDSDFLRVEQARGSIHIEHIIREVDSLQYIIDGTIMAVNLGRTLSSGDSVTFKIEYLLKIPEFSSRLGYRAHHYEMVHWYPKVCVFDEYGWHLDQYHAIGEFYGEYGDYRVELTVPGDYVVAATGERIDSLDKRFIDVLVSRSRKLDMGERKSVRFSAFDVHDFAWICDPHFLAEQYEIDGILLSVFYLKQNEKKWRNAGFYAVEAVKRFIKWYGQYPYSHLSVVNGYAHGGTEYPQLVIIGGGEEQFTRLFEITIIHEIAHQWFYGILGSNELAEPWLDEGFATYSEIRYCEDRYGKDNSLFKFPFVPPVSRRYFYKVIYYLNQTNSIEVPILTPAYRYIDMPFSYMNSAYAKPALFLFNLEGILGRQRFHSILKRYIEKYRFKHPNTEDFIRTCEEESGENLRPLFSQFLSTTDFSDWSIERVVGNSAEIENKGALQMPVDVFVEADSGAHVFRIGSQKSHVIALPLSAGTIRRVIIDPHGYSLEPNYWNNYYPRKLSIKPIFRFPSFDAYQILYLPYVWYGYYDGVQTGLYLFGAQFADFDFVKGRHQWTAGCIYGFKSKNFYPVFSYQTPVIFRRDLRMRLMFRGSNSHGENKLGGGIMMDFGIPFSLMQRIRLTHSLSYYELRSYASVDSVDWDFGRNIIFDNHFHYSYKTWNIQCGLALSNKVMGSEFDYLKTSCEISKEIEAFIPFVVRLFAGRVFGNAPTQERFYLSGALRISMMADLIFGQAGYFSPQNHLHIRGDGNMLGYETLHIKSDELYCINLEFPSQYPIRLFADYGYYGEYAVDFGAKLVLGPISFNFPLYAKTDEPWSLRWSLGVGN